jgi:acetoin utilization protein AcuB
MPTATTIAKVRDFMTTCPHTIDDDKTLADARTSMAKLGGRHLPVVRDGRLVGILSDRDIALAESLLADSGDRTRVPTVADAMTEVVFTCGPEAHLHAVAGEMVKQKHGSAVVVDPEHPLKVLGVFTTSDALRALEVFAPQEQRS